MTDKPVDKNQVPTILTQNPSLVGFDSQDRMLRVRAQVDKIMETFIQALPSNYVSQITGPFYTLQFQAAAEQMAEVQIAAQETWADRDYDFTRPEFLFQVLGALVFPNGAEEGIPDISGDLSYREFLKRMVALLLQGSTFATIEAGVALLTDATVTVIEKSIAARETPGSAWGLDDQFSFEVNIEGWPGGDPFVFQENLRLVLKALRPAHTLYDFRFLFRETFGVLFTDTLAWNLTNYYYEDTRRFCYGIREITGTGGVTLTDRGLFQDTARDFASISPGANLVVTSGPNAGTYRVYEVLTFPLPTDTTARTYVTSPTGLAGGCTMSDGGTLEDSLQDWSNAVEGELVTITGGPNAGTYRLKTVLGNYGGPVGEAVGPGTRCRIAASLLRLETRMPVSQSAQSYAVTVDRLGVQGPHAVVGEDASMYFWGP